MREDGGAAFPHDIVYIKKAGEVDYAQEVKKVQGLTMRDWMAGMAMIAIRAEESAVPEDVAEAAYKQADAMLKQRKEG